MSTRMSSSRNGRDCTSMFICIYDGLSGIGAVVAFAQKFPTGITLHFRSRSHSLLAHGSAHRRASNDDVKERTTELPCGAVHAAILSSQIMHRASFLRSSPDAAP